MDCPCCGAPDVELVPLTARRSDYSWLVCEHCYSNALASDRRVWAFYWRDTPAVDDEVTWREAGAPDPDWDQPAAFDDPWDAYMEAYEDSWPKYGRDSDDEGPPLDVGPPEPDPADARAARAPTWRTSSPKGEPERPSSSAESLAELQARNEQILAASRGGARRLHDFGEAPRVTSARILRGGSWKQVLILMRKPR